MARVPETTLSDIFRAVFNLAEDADVSGIAQDSWIEWDSLATVTLLSAIESEFEIEIDPADALELSSFTQVLTYVNRRLA
jgi:acyl carrier protein